MNMKFSMMDDILVDCERLFQCKIMPGSVSVFIGKLTTYSKEMVEYLGWFDSMPEQYFDAVKFATDLIESKQVIKLNDPSNDIFDEDGIWILNPDDFLESCGDCDDEDDEADNI